MKNKIKGLSFSLLILILAVGCTEQSTSEGNTPQTVTGKVISNIEEPLTEDADYNICNNANINSICYRLDIAFKEGYKEECCNKYDLCC